MAYTGEAQFRYQGRKEACVPYIRQARTLADKLMQQHRVGQEGGVESASGTYRFNSGAWVKVQVFAHRAPIITIDVLSASDYDPIKIKPIKDCHTGLALQSAPEEEPILGMPSDFMLRVDEVLHDRINSVLEVYDGSGPPEYWVGKTSTEWQSPGTIKDRLDPNFWSSAKEIPDTVYVYYVLQRLACFTYKGLDDLVYGGLQDNCGKNARDAAYFPYFIEDSDGSIVDKLYIHTNIRKIAMQNPNEVGIAELKFAVSRDKYADIDDLPESASISLANISTKGGSKYPTQDSADVVAGAVRPILCDIIPKGNRLIVNSIYISALMQYGGRETNYYDDVYEIELNVTGNDDDGWAVSASSTKLFSTLTEYYTDSSSSYSDTHLLRPMEIVNYVTEEHVRDDSETGTPIEYVKSFSLRMADEGYAPGRPEPGNNFIGDSGETSSRIYYIYSDACELTYGACYVNGVPTPVRVRVDFENEVTTSAPTYTYSGQIDVEGTWTGDVMEYTASGFIQASTYVPPVKIDTKRTTTIFSGTPGQKSSDHYATRDFKGYTYTHRIEVADGSLVNTTEYTARGMDRQFNVSDTSLIRLDDIVSMAPNWSMPSETNTFPVSLLGAADNTLEQLALLVKKHQDDGGLYQRGMVVYISTANAFRSTEDISNYADELGGDYIIYSGFDYFWAETYVDLTAGPRFMQLKTCHGLWDMSDPGPAPSYYSSDYQYIRTSPVFTIEGLTLGDHIPDKPMGSAIYSLDYDSFSPTEFMARNALVYKSASVNPITNQVAREFNYPVCWQGLWPDAYADGAVPADGPEEYKPLIYGGRYTLTMSEITPYSWPYTPGAE